jgi:hypothetical protein
MEPKDYEDLYRVGDSQLLRQMSIDNANMALDQAKYQYQSQSMDLQNMYDTLSKRINGGNGYNSLLDGLKKEFEGYSILTIENAKSLTGMDIHYKGEAWKINRVKETNTTYEFLLSKEWIPPAAPIQLKMILSRVPMADKLPKVYSLWVDSNGQWVGIGKELLRDKNEFIKQMLSLTDVPF